MEQKRKVLEYFDNLSSDYERAYEFDKDDPVRTLIFNNRKRIVLDLIDRKAGRLLDVGCGPGIMTKELLKKNFLIYNTDVSPVMIDKAKNALSGYEWRDRVRFKVCDIEDLDFEDSYFDVILCIGVIEYLEDYHRAIEILARILKKGGLAIISIPNKRSIFDLFDNFLIGVADIINMGACTRSKNIRRRGIITKKFSPSLFARELGKYGLSKITMRFHGYRLAALRRIFPRFWIFLNNMLDRISPFFPVAFLANDCVIKFEKQ